jgi:hypothetical protein
MSSLGLAWRWAARAKTQRNFMQRDRSFRLILKATGPKRALLAML